MNFENILSNQNILFQLHRSTFTLISITLMYKKYLPTPLGLGTVQPKP